MEMTLSYDELKLENDALKTELAEVKSQLSWLMEQLSSSRRRLFGPSSEKGIYLNGEVQMGLFGDGESEAPLFDAADTITPEPKAKNRPIKKGELRGRLPDNLPVETIKCELPEEMRCCPKCAKAMKSIGKEVVRSEFKIIPAKAVITEFEQHSYVCPDGCEHESGSSGDPVPIIIKAEMPPQVIKGSMCAPETAAHIITQKCVMGTPIYRQEADWNRNGIPINRQTMLRWAIRVCEDYLGPIFDELHKMLCRHKFIHSDGTPFQVLKEPGKPPQSQSCMWVYRTSGEAGHPIVLYDYQPDKAQERAHGFLKGFAGYLMTDGASSYGNFPDDIILVGCFAHARSGFVDAIKVIKEVENRTGSLADAGLKYCDALFDIERKIKDKTFDERYEVRNKEAAPILDEFYEWLLSAQPLVSSKSKAGSAINYVLNQWKCLIRYLLDGRIEISNNRCERSVKPFVINRKNFLFADTVAGARAAAVAHSITETAKESKLNPQEYLSHIFRTAAGVNLHENHDLVVSLLPENAPASCRVP
jgi:transposase